jgi:hypothetical protein
MKKIILAILLLWSNFAVAQGQFDTPTFTYSGQTYNTRNTGSSIVIKNVNTVFYNASGINLRAAEPERYCSDTEFPVKYKDIGDKLVSLNATLFSKRRRTELELNRDIIDLTLIASKETLQIVEVVFRLKSNTMLTREEIYKMEQAYKTLHVALHPYNPNNCTFNYLVVNIEINPNWEVK